VKNSKNDAGRPVFYDVAGRRWKRFSVAGVILGIATTVLAGFFIVSVLINPFLPQLKLKSIVALPQQPDTKLRLPELPPLTKSETLLKQSSEKAKLEKEKREELRLETLAGREMRIAQSAAPTPSLAESGKPLSIGFYVNWDDSSYTSLKHNIQSLDWVVPEWIRLSGNPSDPLVIDVDDKALDLIQASKPDTPVLPLVQNYKNEEWNEDVLVKSIATEQSRSQLIDALLASVQKNKFGGVTLDVEEVPARYQTDLFIFVDELHKEFQQRGLILAQAVPFDNPDWNYRAYASITDYLMLMAYDQHWSTGEAGPVAGQDWFDSTLKKRMAELNPGRTVVCFGNYGYNWSDNGSEAVTVSFQEALIAARESLDSPTQIDFDPASKNPSYSYDEEDGTTHNVWFLDAVTAYNQIKSSEEYNVAGLALWRLGSEDPSLWKIFGSENDSDVGQLKPIHYEYDVDFDGNGEILQVKAEPQDGEREIAPAGDGSITKESYEKIPSSYVVLRTGDKPGKIVLTFDDGPDPVWTPKILDVLKQENVKAAFFVVGENGQANPELVKRIAAEGHEIGNHSFTHPNLAEVPSSVMDLELNTTQRLIESLTGRSTRLFRAPYFGDAEPHTPDEVEPTVEAQNLGYISIGLHLDPDDWKTRNDDGSPHSADQIANEVFAAAENTTPEERGSIVLLHDSGGDRSATVEALPKIIEGLRQRGYEFTTIGDLAGITRDEEMPVVQRDGSLYAAADSYVFYFLSVAGWILKWVFLIGIILGIARMVFIGMLAFAQFNRSRNREVEHFGESFQPEVSVVIPAFNEERVIGRTIRSILECNYNSLEIIVIDDGSKDLTYEAALSAATGHSNVHVYRKENGGKAEALNFGWKKSGGDVIVALDADTIFSDQTIAALAHRFADKKIGAIAGNAKVGNRINIVTKWQALEYVTSQNFDRRAFSSLNCITVVPGAVGAWRRDVLEETGGFSIDTLAEDQDLTIAVRKLGYRIGYEENAVAFTEAPDSLRNLAKQRFRWSFGTLQCMWKHRNALLNPRHGTLGFVAMPNVWIFQVLFPLISPFMDLVFIWTILSALVGYLEHQQEYAHTPTNLNQVIFYYALFLALDWAGAFAAFLMEKKEQKRLLWWLLIQRFGYRQVMYWVMVKSVFTAIRGAVVGWGKLERKATVEAQARV
jgi:cellulose synthase/poly-beta-1,6-N-acetylglucosamine synthase-like glycosyltransferase/peptidoglycan/xylan/chitin deacetylase (PgdA/CDA1 family)/spore germination protein YaaH